MPKYYTNHNFKNKWHMPPKLLACLQLSICLVHITIYLLQFYVREQIISNNAPSAPPLFLSPSNSSSVICLFQEVQASHSNTILYSQFLDKLSFHKILTFSTSLIAAVIYLMKLLLRLLQQRWISHDIKSLLPNQY